MVYEQEYMYPAIPEYYYYPHSMQFQQYQHPAQFQSYYPEYEYYDERPFYYSHFTPPYQGAYPQSPTKYLMSPSSENSADNRMMQQFLDANGQVDIQKMLKTIGQFADTVQQVSPVIKQINDLIRSFRN